MIDYHNDPVEGYHYILNVCDHWSKVRFSIFNAVLMTSLMLQYTWLIPLKDKSADSVLTALLSIMKDVGPPHIFQADNGSFVPLAKPDFALGKEFTNAKLSSLLEQLTTKEVHGRPYHPQSQGITFPTRTLISISARCRRTLQQNCQSQD